MIKRIFDLIISIIGVIMLLPIIIIVWVLSSFDTNSSGLFFQKRIGQFGNSFTIYKFRTMHFKSQKISNLGSGLLASKLDELPQLFNVIIGNMSIVGPRPDITGYYDKLEGTDKKVLELKPGITSMAAIIYENEEAILSGLDNPLEYNDKVIFPEKVKLNLEYYHNRSIWVDVNVIFKTLAAIFKRFIKGKDL